MKNANELRIPAYAAVELSGRTGVCWDKRVRYGGHTSL